jgi:hypothetical protein
MFNCTGPARARKGGVVPTVEKALSEMPRLMEECDAIEGQIPALEAELKEFSEKPVNDWNAAIIGVGTGHGFVIQGTYDDRYVITAVHCLLWLPRSADEPHRSARGGHLLIFPIDEVHGDMSGVPIVSDDGMAIGMLCLDQDRNVVGVDHPRLTGSIPERLWRHLGIPEAPPRS